MPLTVRLVEDVQLVGRLCGTFPQLTNLIMRIRPVARIMKRALGVHPDRKLPDIASESFDAWAKARGLGRMREGAGRKVAYFVGCTARYLFPEVAKATVVVLEANGVSVHVPEQTCCGMPTYLEGDRNFTFRLAEANLKVLKHCIEAGYDVVTACPTCSFALKSVLARGAQYSPARRERVKALAEAAGGDTKIVCDQLEAEAKSFTGRANAFARDFYKPWVINQLVGRRYAGEAKEEGYFAILDAELRILIASHTWELGEYLRDMDAADELTPAGALPAEKFAYFAPCHLREQSIGQPWADLLAKQPGTHLTEVGDTTDCCGLGGTMGFKAKFHDVSLAMGRNLMEKTSTLAPDRVLTECLGCRLQFTQMLNYPVSHPVEVLAKAYSDRPGASG
ncbi:MAG: heterodisulfide reductase-related iron-sulfur binding cluster [Ancalomicrobiaceae bacterium]|nr:heterodisulfide reductase-related iron-sulfur binding cluster [Ancalomicrobiaceae bacterium]